MTRLLRVISIVMAAVAIIAYGGASIYTKAHMDRNGPEIQMEEDEITVSVKDEAGKLLEGITAKDKIDGDVTDSLVLESLGAFMGNGKRPVTIVAFDSDRNVAKAMRTVKYSDYISPRISMTEPLRAPVNDVQKLTKGITVSDCLEGDITENVQITPVEEGLNYNVPGEYAMKLIVSNNAGDVVELPVTIELYDYSMDGARPKPLLSQYLVYTKVGQAIDPMAYLTGVEMRGTKYDWNTEGAVPPIDSSQVTVESGVDYQTPGVYEVCYRADDGNGNIGCVRLIVVVEE